MSQKYEEVLEFLFNQLPMYQRQGKAAYKANLDNTLTLDKYFNHPHQTYRTIHVAGTNGKGSVSHMLASIFQEAGYKTGLYTSPHLKDFRERIRVNGEMIAESNVIEFVNKHKAIIEKIEPSFFEMTVAMAFDYFRQEKVDVAIIETGLGGRLDSTNIISPELSLITNIGLDHTQFLGDTLSAIAAEKAGIIKEGIPVIVGEKQLDCCKVFQDKANQNNAPLYFASEEIQVKENSNSLLDAYKGSNMVVEGIDLQLKGEYQKKNVSLVLLAIEKLLNTFNINNTAIKNGLKKVVDNTGLKGRWQVLNTTPLVICDTGHNVEGITYLTQQLERLEKNQLHFVLGMVNDKDISKVLNMLPKDAIYYFTQASIPRAMPLAELTEMARKCGLKGEAFATVEFAYKKAVEAAQSKDVVFVGGSTFVVAEIPDL